MIISLNSLKEKLDKDKNIVILDVRYDLQDEAAGRRAYQNDHIPSAFYIDLKEDLSGPTQNHGGAHPLPNPEKLSKTLGNIGINHETPVIIYDEDNGMFAARAWWVLFYIGLEKIYVLDGGYALWKKAGLPVTEEIPKENPVELIPKVRENLYVNMEEVKEKVSKDEAILIDSRAPERYRGEVEPLYEKAGHIPGAVNYFYKNVYNGDGTWKNQEELKSLYKTLPKKKEIIVSCGSGVSACSNILGLRRAGFKNVKLYPGSYSDWISYEENEVVNVNE